MPQDKVRSRFHHCCFLIALILLGGAITGLMPGKALAESSGDLDYRLINNGTEVEITGYHGAGGAVMVPSTIASLPVSSIGDSAFYGQDGITSLVAPTSVKMVGWSAFFHCSSLSSVSMPGAVSIGDDAFRECTALTTMGLGTSLLSIGDGAFRSCSSLTTISIPASVTSMGEMTFSDCGSLTSISVASGNPQYSSVGGVLFDKEATVMIRCPGGRSGTITLPDTTSSVRPQALAGCHLLTSIVVGPANPWYSSLNGVLYDKDMSELVRCPGGKAGAFTVPEGVMTIRADAFTGCHLTSLDLPDSVTDIGASAFSLSTSLTWVELPALLSSIPDWAFYGCTGLVSIEMPAQVASIGQYAFFGCSGLGEIRFLGDAPSCGEGWVEGHGVKLTVRYYLGASGFTMPCWQGLSAIGTPPPQVPGAPTDLAITILSDRVMLAWKAPTGPVTDYLILRGAGVGALVPIGESQTPSYLDDEVERGQTYCYAIIARNDLGESSMSPTVNVTVPLLPVQVTGRVVNSEGDGVEGINVTLGGSAVRTDMNGRFLFTTTSGDHTLRFSGQGIEECNITFTAEGSDQDLGAITMRSVQDPTGVSEDPLAMYMMFGAAAVLLVTLSLLLLFFIKGRARRRL